MTTKADFSEQEWKLVLEGPTSAGMYMIYTHHGGMLRETISLAKAYAEARGQHGQSELLDAIVATKPVVDHTRAHSREEFEEHFLTLIREAVALLDGKATAQELQEYKGFTVHLAEKVAEAHRENGRGEDPVSDVEKTALVAIQEALG